MRNIIFLSITLLGFGGSYVFYLFTPPPFTLLCTPELQCGHWIVFRPELFFDKHSHFYLIGERIMIAAAYVGAWVLIRNYVTFTTAILFLLYIGDYILFFNDPIPKLGVSYAYFMAGALTIMWIVEIIRLISQWKQQVR